MGLILMFLGLIGCFIPIIPSPITSWFGFLILYFSSNNLISFKFLIFTLLISILFFLGDFILPLITAKKFGSSKKGIIGTGVGLFLGFFILGPLGIILGACLGAFIGELMNNKGNEKILGSVVGAILGVLSGIILKLVVSLVFLFIYLEKFIRIYF
ncbi:MAG: hypothetical protein CMC59_00715 [Flavobacteriaceae bacterium]|nr:hypothetical protein [Flavobacteriaceae bacterium]